MRVHARTYACVCVYKFPNFQDFSPNTDLLERNNSASLYRSTAYARHPTGTRLNSKIELISLFLNADKHLSSVTQVHQKLPFPNTEIFRSVQAPCLPLRIKHLACISPVHAAKSTISRPRPAFCATLYTNQQLTPGAGKLLI